MNSMESPLILHEAGFRGKASFERKQVDFDTLDPFKCLCVFPREERRFSWAYKGVGSAL